MCAPPHPTPGMTSGFHANISSIRRKKNKGKNEARLKSFLRGAPPSKKNSGSALDGTAQNKYSSIICSDLKGHYGKDNVDFQLNSHPFFT